MSTSLLDTITWGTQLSDPSVSVYFGPAGYSQGGYTSEGFNAYEIGQFQKAFDLISSVSAVTFTISNTPGADFNLVLDTNEANGSLLGSFAPPGYSNSGDGFFNGASWDRVAGGDLSVGGYGFSTIIHELLHGLGLAHPHDTGGSSKVMQGVQGSFGYYGDHDLNQGVFTTLSYNSGYHTGPEGTRSWGSTGTSFGFTSGAMALDIAVLQNLYGANATTASGDDLYILPTGQQTGTFWHSIWDTGGTDEIRYTGTQDVIIDLRPATLEEEDGGGGFLSHVARTSGGFSIANGATIENATGGSGADTLTGNEENNEIYGGDGFDTLYGGGGNDTLDGGNHADLIYGGTGSDRILGGAGFDNLYGDGGDDTILGGDRPDRIWGGDGNDRILGGINLGLSVDGLYGGAGNDEIYGAGGFDHIVGDDGDDALYGGNQADNLYGGLGNDSLLGGAGFDRLFAGPGDDYLDSGDGSDGLFGQHGNDTVIGGTDSDRVWGNAGSDTLFGGAGDDTLRGGSDFDTLHGGTGNDCLWGNFNADTFVFLDGHGVDLIHDFNANNDFEKMDVTGLTTINSLADVTANATQLGADVFITTGASSSITLKSVTLADLDAVDFLF